MTLAPIGDRSRAEMAAGTGTKDDFAKPRYDLLAPEFIDGRARRAAIGARKYSDRNWEHGMRWGRPFAAAMRHAWAWARRERDDPETGVHHLVAAAFNLMMLVAYEARGLGEDDRTVAGRTAVRASKQNS